MNKNCLKMRIFVTGATGFIGIEVVKELIAAGYQVLGLCRTDEGAQALISLGASVLQGSLEDLESLKQGALASDAVIHLAFIHDFSKFLENCEKDRLAIDAIGSVLIGTDRPFIVTSGAAAANPKPGEFLRTEDGPLAPSPRMSEVTILEFIAKGVKGIIVRLPQVHDTRKQGLVSYLIPLAQKSGVSVYEGEGANRWSAVHVSDCARLYRLALEKGNKGSIFHCIGEEGIPMREIAEAIGRHLNIPVKSLKSDETPAILGDFFAAISSRDLSASSAITQKLLGWEPLGSGLIADIDAMNK